MRFLERVRRCRAVVAAVAASPMPWCDAWLSARMLAWAVVLPVLKRVVPLATLVRAMWKPGRKECRDRAREHRIVLLAILCTRAVCPSNAGACLNRSLLAYRFLSESCADPRLMVAFQKSGAALAGHAWVVVDGQGVGDPPGVRDGFLPIVAFGARGSRIAAPWVA